MATAAVVKKNEMPEDCLEVFPVEVWERVLCYLRNEDLLTCRLVCRDLLSIVDDQYENEIWKPYFAKNRIADALSLFLVKCQGTRFSAAEDIDHFLEEMKDFNGNGKSPFFNRTIIMNCCTVGQYSLLCQRFPALVEKFGDYVRHCLYFVHNEVIPSIKNIPVIFQMKNLRSLTIYCADWDKRSIRANLSKWKADPFKQTPLKNFTSLNILGDRGYMVLRTLFSGYGPQIKRLNCWGHNLMEDASREFAKDVTDTLPNLEEFKVCDVSCVLLSSISKATWPLKRLAVKISLSDDTVSLGAMLESFRKFAGTLNSFHLQVEEKQLHNNVYAYNIQFPVVTDLRVPYYFVNRGNISTLVDVAKKFKNVKHLQLVDSEEHPGTLDEKRQAREKAISVILESMWEKLPSDLEVISVRFRVYTEELRSNVSVVMKYIRNATKPTLVLPKVLQEIGLKTEMK